MSMKLINISSQKKLDHAKKSRRSSKISAALKTRFLEMLQDERTTIKYVRIENIVGCQASMHQLFNG